MYGILSEEGFEAIHPLINRLLADLKPIMDAEGRMQTLANRVHKSFNPKIENIKVEFRFKLRGRYHNRPKAYKKAGHSRNQTNGVVESYDLKGIDGGTYFELENDDGIIKTSWKMCTKCFATPESQTRGRKYLLNGTI
jgi:hypothetical protein